MHDRVIGKGTCLIVCQFCGKSMLDGRLIEHWQSGECQEISAKKHHREKHNNTESRLKELEDKAKDSAAG